MGYSINHIVYDGSENADSIELYNLGEKYNTDKHIHGYTHHYAKIFTPLRNKPIRLLEIGTYRGGSIRLWLEYFPSAYIYGMDLRRSPVPEQRYSHLVMNQIDERLRDTYPDNYFNIIIDDGSHYTYHQQRTLELLWSKVVPGGMYIIEDLYTSFRRKYLDALYTTYDIVSGKLHTKEFDAIGVEIDSIDVWHRHKLPCDSIMAVINKRGENGIQHTA